MANGSVTLREYLQEQINHEREVREVNERSAALALQLQAAEYDRRLTSLNHEHERTREVLAASVTRELFEARVLPLERAGNRQGGATAAMLAAVAIAGTIIGLVLGALRLIP